ncbi:MAG: DUF4230 domain-containing protein [Nonlabens sp.]
MRSKIKIIILLILTAIVSWAIYSWLEDNRKEEELIAQTALIRNQIEHTSKLVVTELSYAKVYTYENSRKYGWDFFSVQKKALVISEPKVQISYDLKKLTYELEPESKSIYLTHIPEPEININPQLTFYSIQDEVLNRFEAKDYNKIRNDVTAKIRKDILADPELKNAQNRLLTELSSIYVLTNSMGWTLIYEDNKINSTKELDYILK